MNNNLLSINPVEHYIPPNIPTLSEALGNPALLKKLPSRWQKNAAVIACAGIIGVTALTGCSDVINPLNNIPGPCPVNPLDFYCHCGGAGEAPFYVVHLTEQEMWGIIRSQLEAAGLNFNAEPPDFVLEIDGWSRNVYLELFDEEKSVAIADIRAWRELAERASQEFAEQLDDITVGVFYRPNGREWWDEPTDEERAETIAKLEEQLSTQVQEFINFLRAEEIL